MAAATTTAVRHRPPGGAGRQQQRQQQPFSVKVSNYEGNAMLNICDVDLLGRDIAQDGLYMHISKGYYGQNLVDREEAARLLRGSSIINMVGRQTVDLSLELGIGSVDGVRTISGVPFLIVFKM